MLNLVRCRVYKIIIIFKKRFLQEIITSLGLLVNLPVLYMKIFIFFAQIYIYIYILLRTHVNTVSEFPGIDKSRYRSLCLFILNHPF